MRHLRGSKCVSLSFLADLAELLMTRLYFSPDRRYASRLWLAACMTDCKYQARRRYHDNLCILQCFRHFKPNLKGKPLLKNVVL